MLAGLAWSMSTGDWGRRRVAALRRRRRCWQIGAPCRRAPARAGASMQAGALARYWVWARLPGRHGRRNPARRPAPVRRQPARPADDRPPIRSGRRAPRQPGPRSPAPCAPVHRPADRRGAAPAAVGAAASTAHTAHPRQSRRHQTKPQRPAAGWRRTRTSPTPQSHKRRWRRPATLTARTPAHASTRFGSSRRPAGSLATPPRPRTLDSHEAFFGNRHPNLSRDRRGSKNRCRPL